MARPPLPPGEHGKIAVTEVAPKLFRARCRYRDLTGGMHWAERTGPSKTTARKALTDALAARRPATVDDARPYYAKISTAVELYRAELAQQVADGALRPTTAMRYTPCLARIDAGLGSLRIPELTPGRISTFLTDLQRLGLSADSRRTHRAVLGNILRLLTENDITPPDLMKGLRRITGTRKAPRALTLAERRHLLDYLDHDPRMRQRGMPDLARFMLGTGCRIGEVLAVRWCDVDLDGVPLPAGDVIEMVPVVAITGNIVEVKGRGLLRHEGKTDKARRVIPLPTFVTGMLRARRADGSLPEEPVFPAQLRTGQIGYKRPSLVQSWMREMRNEVGMPWLTSHHFRKTAATILHDAGLPDRQIGGITGHADLTTLLNVYVARGELHPQAAAALDAAYGDR